MNAVALRPEPTPRCEAPLVVEPALRRFHQRVGNALERGGDDLRQARRRTVLAILEERLAARVDTVDTFEAALNGCLDVGYRSEPLAAFVFDVLQRRLAARVRRRLARSGHDPDSAEVADLVALAAEAIQKLIRGARREKHTLRYALLVSIADHRTIDYLRRRRPEYRDTMDDCVSEVSDGARHHEDPERALWRAQRMAMALRLREAVAGAVNELKELERAALILVEIHGYGYPEVSERLGIKRTDVGNVVRRARMARDRALVPRLRTLPGFEHHVGFSGLQADRELRLQMLHWTAEVGDGLCTHCLEESWRMAPAGCSAH